MERYKSKPFDAGADQIENRASQCYMQAWNRPQGSYQIFRRLRISPAIVGLDVAFAD